MVRLKRGADSLASPTHEQVRSVEWSSKFLWDVLLDGAPAPFSSWFPATDVQEELAKLSSYSFDAHITKGKIPQATDVKTVQLTYVDDAKNTLSSFIANWINNTILNGGKSVSALLDSVKSLQVTKLNRQRVQLTAVTYYVYPEGTVAYEGNGTSDALTYTTTFVIAGSNGGSTTVTGIETKSAAANV